MLVLLFAAPLLALLGWSAVQLHQAAQDDIAASAQIMAGMAARQYSQRLGEARSLLAALSHMPQLRGEQGECAALLRRLLADRPGYANLGVIAADGRVQCSAMPFEPGLNLGDRAYFSRALTTNSFAGGEYHIGRITGKPSIHFGYPLRGPDGRSQAVVFAAVDTTWLLTSLTQSEALPASSTVKLLDHRLHLVVRYPDWVGGTQEKPPRGNSAAFAAAMAVRPGGGSYMDRGLDGVSRLYVYTRLGDAAAPLQRPYLVIGLPLHTLQTQQERIIFWLVGGGAVAVTLLGALAWLIVHHRVIAPTHRLVSAAGRMARGELGVRLGDIGGAAEFSAVAAAFDHMAIRTDAATRALSVLSAGNRSLLREQDEQALLEAMCRVAVDVGGYLYAWVAYATETGLRQMAAAGDDGGFAAYLEAHWDVALADQTPTARVIATGEAVVLQDTVLVRAEHDLFEAAASRGLLAGILLPLKVDGKTLGTLTIYASEPDVFGPREAELLTEMAEDLAFGITTARLRERHRQADAQLRQLAYFDPVTALPNRSSFLERLEVVPTGTVGALAVLVVDLHNYWELAATLGHACGDELLRAVTERLQALSPALLARVAQSEFALLLPDTDEAAASHYAQGILDCLAQPASLSAVSADIRATLGIALGGRRRGDGERLLQAARLAAREARSGTSGFLLARPKLEHEWTERLTLATDLRVAIQNRDLRVYVQPQLDLRSGRICGMEALARWQHPIRGEVPPSKFIGLAEQTGLIRPLTYAVLETVRELAQRHADADLLLPIAVNISARNLHDPEFVGCITEFLGRWPLPRDCLHLELTETAVMDDPIRSLQVLRQLRDLGLAIYLDDFGSGYSSLAYLQELPLRGLKIDRAFVARLAQPDTQRIVQTVIDLGHALGLTVVAEGVEERATLDVLARLGCDIAQGYGIARPMAGEALAPWLATWADNHTRSRPNSAGEAV